MPKLVAGLAFAFFTCGSCAFAQDTSSAAQSSFPSSHYLPLPPHFQPRPAFAAARIINAPPPLPVYAQPAIPEDGYLWVPGFWAWRDDVPDYYWVPGTWVKPPRPGLLWTPAYWSRIDGGYVFHAGYWAERVGFYGGIHYGYGYTGEGYQGGEWKEGVLFYNRAVNNLGSVNGVHVSDKAVAEDENVSRVSFNGGSNGIKARPMPQEALGKEQHFEPTAEQRKHFEMAAKDRSLYSKLNDSEPE